MLIEVDKKDLIDMIKSIKPDMDTCIELTSEGWMDDIGNGWSCGWEWNRKFLDFLTTLEEEDIYEIYKNYK